MKVNVNVNENVNRNDLDELNLDHNIYSDNNNEKIINILNNCLDIEE